jgi:para-nitrobenzyl esterase
MSAVVMTGDGAVRGRELDGVTSFLGIPYAAPPYGANRFRRPVRPTRWDGVRDAVEFGATAAKPSYSPPTDVLLPEPVIPGDECLNLNVWTPDPGAAGLPVMVWIHGGAFTHGSSAVPWYAGDRFARDGVVCVTINYRLGCDGYLWLDDATPNRGLLDQLAALEWVQENVAAFGGDPANVTIFGESAGAMSATAILSVPAAEGLFRRAILQSGAGHHTLTVETAKLVTAALARRLDVTPTAAAFGSVPLARLIAAQDQLAKDIATDPEPWRWNEIATNVMPFEPIVDGGVLPAAPIDGVAQGIGRAVDLLVGTNLDEHRLFLVPSGALGAIDDATLLVATGALGLGPKEVSRYRTGSQGPGAVLAAVAADWFFRIPAIRLAEAHQGTTHMYEFTWPSPLFDGQLGACHALEIPFVFETLDSFGGEWLTGPSPPAALAATMHRAWVAFARTGEPGWPAYDVATRTTMTFDLESAPVEDPRSERRVVWTGIR